MGLKDILRIAEDAVNLKTKTQGQRRTKKNQQRSRDMWDTARNPTYM